MPKSIDILMVDDRPDGLLALEALLSENKSYRLVKAQSGLEALGLLEKYDFAVILLDVQMPGLDGFQTAELIRKSPEFCRIPIIFVTALNKDDRYVYKGYQSGAVDYIFKPFDPFILTSKVSVFAELHRQKRLLRAQAAELRVKEEMEFEMKIQKAEIDSLRRYRNLADSIPHIVWRSKPSGALEYCNRIWRSFTGRTLEESLGMGWQESIHSPDLKNLLGVWMQAIQTGDSFEIECRIRRHDGKMRWHLIRAVPEKGAVQEVLAWLGTGTDIHDRKTAERSLVQAQKAAESANRTKSQFLANMSHEIRTPLGAIIGFTELTLEEDAVISAEERRRNLSIVHRNGHQLLKIIDEILDVSKIEAGRLEVEKVETDLADLLAGLFSLLQVSASGKGVRLCFQIEDQIPSDILTDETRLRQILMNVVGNAIKFTDAGEVLLTVGQSVQEGESLQLWFRVKDTGIGMSSETIEKLFTPFLQGDLSTTRLYGGTGLGLVLARQLARALGGDVVLESSEVGHGTTFLVQVLVEALPQSKPVRNWPGEEASLKC